jgi:2-succinyl-5-enolpyruvyl-6-hydroxy-3-cyclohexene-1-carboxylate synthase
LTVILLHALPLDERMWEGQRAVLADHDVVAPRLYGRGRTMAEWAESVAGEVDGVLTVVGCSMGGYCALALARLAPERVRALMLVGARPDPDSPERRAGRADTIELIRHDGADGLWQAMLPKLVADPNVLDKSLLHRDADELIAAVEAIRDRPDSTELVRSFTGPLQFVVGEHEAFVTADELLEFPVREVAGSGHLVNLERPAEFDDILREFLARA